MRAWLVPSLLTLVVLPVAGGCTSLATYESCITTSDCGSSFDTCEPVVTAVTAGSFCSSGCIDELDCPSAFGFTGACLDVDGAGGLCYQRCDSDFDCAADTFCFEVDTFTGGGVIFVDFVCLPDNGFL
ncbi:MAG: hypothetical protein ACFCGT_01820 [Sandaracinaceae bacterium]